MEKLKQKIKTLEEQNSDLLATIDALLDRIEHVEDKIENDLEVTIDLNEKYSKDVLFRTSLSNAIHKIMKTLSIRAALTIKYDENVGDERFDFWVHETEIENPRYYPSDIGRRVSLCVDRMLNEHFEE